MASALSAEERMRRFLKSLERWEAVRPAEKPPVEDKEAPQPESSNITAQDSFWKYEEPVSEEDEVEEMGSESLRLQNEFLKENGYNWWAPPPDKIKPKGYRPSQNRVRPQAGNIENVDLTRDPRCGEPAPQDLKFTPFLAICKFPYKFVCKEWSQPVASAIFDDSKIQNREWDLYYVYNNIDCPKPCIFVSEAQFTDLIDEINESFSDANITISDKLKDEGLVIDFSDIEDPDLRPRWLGHSNSRAQTDHWPDMLTPTECKHDTMSKEKELELFREKMDLAYEIGRAKKKAAKKAKQEQAVIKRQGMAKELVRAQKYLGLLPADEESLLPDIASLSLGPLDPTKPSLNVFIDEPIFIAIDVEAHERQPNPVTEVGVATLDTRDLKNIAPGANGEAWHGAIRARHFRIAEYKHLVNKDFVEGCPEHFEFGRSEMIGRDKIASKLASCFHAPFSATHMVDKEKFGDKQQENDHATTEGDERRDIIFLGHDVNQDVAYCRKIGFDPLNRGNLLETMDTSSMYRAYTHNPDLPKLGSILYSFDLTAWHLHNAGNDAVYTIWAMLAMAVASATERGKPEVSQRRAEEFARREGQAVKEAKERVREGAEGWELGGSRQEGVRLDAGGSAKGKEKAKASGAFVPWQGSETGLYTADGYPLDV